MKLDEIQKLLGGETEGVWYATNPELYGNAPTIIRDLLKIARAAKNLPSSRELIDAMEGRTIRDFMIVMQHYANEFGALSLALKALEVSE